MVRFGDMSLADLRGGAARDGVTVAPTVRPDHGLPGARRARLPAARPLRPHAAAARRRRHPARLRDPARDEPPLRRRVPRRPQPRAQPRAAVASLPHRPAGHAGAPVLGSAGRPERHRHPPDAPVGRRPLARRRRRRRVQPRAADPRRAAPALPEHGRAGDPRQRSGHAEQRRDDGQAGDLRRLPRARRRLLRLRPHRRRPAPGRRLVLRHPGADHRAPLRARRVATGRRALTAWRQAAWPDTGIDAATPFTVEDLRAVRHGQRAAAGARRRRHRGRGAVPAPRPGARPRPPPRRSPRRPDGRPRPDRHRPAPGRARRPGHRARRRWAPSSPPARPSWPTSA